MTYLHFKMSCALWNPRNWKCSIDTHIKCVIILLYNAIQRVIGYWIMADYNDVWNRDYAVCANWVGTSGIITSWNHVANFVEHLDRYAKFSASAVVQVTATYDWLNEFLIGIFHHVGSTLYTLLKTDINV